MRLILVLLPLFVVSLGQGVLAAKATTCGCGWVNSGRIVGGHETKKNEFPWMAALYNTRAKRVGCGAAIITKYHALTAAHCSPLMRNNEIVLLIGAHDTRNPPASNMVPIENLIIHSTYNTSAPISDDIALVVTKTAIPFSTIVGPVCLPTGPIHLDNQMVRATGWGRQGWSVPESPFLKGINVYVISHYQCSRYWQLVQPKKQICVMDTFNGPCKGDSGGPWVWLDPETNRYTLVGVTSYGGQCKFPPPAVQTEVGVYIDWIKQQIRAHKPENICTKV